MANSTTLKISVSFDSETSALLQSLVDALHGFCLPATANPPSKVSAPTNPTLAAMPEAVTPVPALTAPILPTVPPTPAPANAPTNAAPIAQVPVAPPIVPAPSVQATAPAFQIPGMRNTPTTAPQVPTGETQYTVEQLMRAGADLMNAGKNPMALFQQFGIQNVMQLPKDQYGAFATALRQMGAKI